MTRRRFELVWPHVRDVILFVAGIAGIAHETLINHADRPNLLILYGAMLSLPLFTRDGPKR